jgi:hypothetical protein
VKPKLGEGSADEAAAFVGDLIRDAQLRHHFELVRIGDAPTCNMAQNISGIAE